jgi:TP901 family phage tail tape measure protein
MAKFNVSVLIEAIDKASKPMKDIANRMDAMGRKALIAGGAITAGLGASVKIAADFDKQMSNVSTLLDTNVESMAAMKTQILDISGRVPVALQDLTAGLYDVRSAGIDASNAMDTLERSARLGVAGLGTTQQSVDIMTSALNAYKSNNLKAADAQDVIFKTVKFGKTTIDKLSQSFGATVPIVQAAGVAFDDFNAATAALTTSGMPASQAQNNIRAAVVSLQKPTKEMETLFKKLGVTTGSELIQKMGGLGPAFQAIRQSAKETGIQIERAVGSVEGSAAVIALSGDQNEAYVKTLADMRSGVRAVDEAFAKQAATTAAKWQVMVNRLQKVAIDIGQALMPVVEKLASFIGKAAEAFGKLPEPAKKAIAIVAAIIGVALIAIGGLLVVLAPVVTAVGAVAGALSIGLAPAFGVVAAVIAAVIGLVVAFALSAYQVISHWSQIRSFFIGLWAGIRAGVQQVVAFISTRLIAIVPRLLGAWSSVRAMLTGVWNGITGAVQRAVGAVGRFISLASNAVSKVKSIGAGVVGRIGARAVGGHVRSGIPYQVGEFGRELFVPGMDGRIISNNALRSSSGSSDGRIAIHLRIDSEGRPHLMGVNQSGGNATLSLDMGLVNSYG